MKLELESLEERIAPSAAGLTPIFNADVAVLQSSLQTSMVQVAIWEAQLPAPLQGVLTPLNAQMETIISQLPATMNAWWQQATPDQQTTTINTFNQLFAAGLTANGFDPVSLYHNLFQQQPPQISS